VFFHDNDDIEQDHQYVNVYLFHVLVQVIKNQLQIQYAKYKKKTRLKRKFLLIKILTSRILDRANSANSLLISIPRGDRIATPLCGSFYKK